MTSLVPEVVDARRIGKDVEQLAIMLSQGKSSKAMSAEISTWIPIRFIAPRCYPESKTKQTITARIKTWITQKWASGSSSLVPPPIYL